MSSHAAFVPPRECEQPYTITEINDGIASIIEAGNTLVWVEGEISGWKPSSSGHCYFRLKDASSQIPAVIWRTMALELQFKPADGMAVMAIASIRVYARGGYYQLDIHKMQPLGQGALHAAFLKLKAKLEREGLFDPSFKKPLPASVNKIGVVTSKNGAVIRDIVRVVFSRAPQTEIVLHDVAVQGAGAALQIVQAIEAFNIHDQVDCLIVGRGGGSMEDLQPFNEECVARAIFSSKIPVISAVGHEIDFTIADFVADVRAATPSAGAELAVADREDDSRLYTIIADRFRRSTSRYFQACGQRFTRLVRHSAFRKPWRLYLEAEQQNDELRQRQQQSIVNILEVRAIRCAAVAKQLSALNPLAVLARGYSVVFNEHGHSVRSTKELRAGEKITIRFSEGTATGQIETVQ